MKISAKTEYACIAMMELAVAAQGSGEPVRIRDIASRHGIPSRFLVQILLQLKGAGLVASTRGASGGYQLQRPPQEITLAEVMSVFDRQEERIATSASPKSPAVPVLLETWQEILDVQREMLAGVTFADLADRARATDGSMYYI